MAAPVVLTVLGAGVGTLLGVPAALCVAAALAILGLAGWRAVRDRGLTVVLRSQGVEISRGEKRDAFAFDDVDEVWLELSALHPQAGAPLRALRVVEFGGAVHRVPTAVRESQALVASILRAIQGPLLVDARKALQSGVELNFGFVRVTRDAVVVDGVARSWNEVRRVVVSHGRAHLYGRAPLIAWRTISLGRVPNAPVLLGIIAQCASNMRIDDMLMLPDYSDGAPARPTGHERRAALWTIAVGAAVGLLALVVALATYSRGSGFRVIAFGTMVWSGVRVVQGVSVLLRSSPRR
ncbi:MAG: hypothetical protein JNL21_01650 [Myxococcales bacterium]|nr:hypothetical protein [Myxococcales bacterium]